VLIFASPATKAAEHYILCGNCFFCYFNKIHGVNPDKKQVLGGFCLLSSRVYIADTRVMQSLHKNGNPLFKDFQDFFPANPRPTEKARLP
jgi:hypothetical protein